MGLSVGDTILYTVTVDNQGLLPLGNTLVIDTPTTNLTYITNSTTYNGTPIADNAGPYSATNTAFPLDNIGSSGYTIPVILGGGSSTFSWRGPRQRRRCGQQQRQHRRQFHFLPDPAGAAAYQRRFRHRALHRYERRLAGELLPLAQSVYVTMTNTVIVSNTIETISVTVNDTNSGDAETIIASCRPRPTASSSAMSAACRPRLSPAWRQQDGTLHVSYADTLTVSYTDPSYLDSNSDTATILVPVPNKQLYLTANGVARQPILEPRKPRGRRPATPRPIPARISAAAVAAASSPWITPLTATRRPMPTTMTVLHTTGATANYMLVTVGIFTYHGG